MGALALTLQVFPPSLDRAKLSKGGAVGSRSPPPTTPWDASRNSTLKIPAEGLPLKGVSWAAQRLPPSLVARILAAGPAPPVPIQARFSPCVATQVPLDANPASPGKAGGRLSPMSRQLVPSLVRRAGKRPFTESLKTMPRSE